LIGGGVVRLQCSGTITVPQSISITRMTVLDATNFSLTLAGGGTGLYPMFVVAPGVSLGLNTLQISTGSSTNGAAILNLAGTVNATNCVFANNKAAPPSGAAGAAGADGDGSGKRGGDGGSGLAGLGGVVYNASGGTNSFVRCTFSSNTATGGGGGAGGAGGDGTFEGGRGGDGGSAGAGWGGALYNAGVLRLTDCAFTGNKATGGAGAAGGAAGNGAWGVADGVSTSGATGAGGALYNVGVAVLTGCTMDANTAVGGAAASDGGVNDALDGRTGPAGGTAVGGAIYNGGQLQLINCTVYTNVCAGAAGGVGGDGAWIGGDGGDGGAAAGGGLYSVTAASVTNCTFASNVCSGGAAGAAGGGMRSGDAGQAGTAGGANVASAQGSVTLRSTILAGGGTVGNASGTITDAGCNLSSDLLPRFGQSSSTNGVDPELGTLADYGGETSTLALLNGSPAIDRGGVNPGVTSDQRGVARPQGTASDIGAFEREIANLSGWVLSGTNSVPAAIEVVLENGDGQKTRVSANTNGSFIFADVTPGPYLIYLADALRDRFAPAEQGLYLADLASGQTNLDFQAYSLTLAGIGNKEVNELQVLTFACPATDGAATTLPRVFSLDAGAPAGATIGASSGVFSWTPTESDGGTTNSITVRVADAEQAWRADARTFLVVVKETNAVPTLDAIADQVVAEGSLVRLTVVARDTDLPTNKLAFSLVAPPAGAAIDASSGVFTWTPAENQGPGTNRIVVRVSDDASPSAQAEGTFRVVVTEVNAQPQMNAIADQQLMLGRTLRVTPVVSDSDLPANVLSFRLINGPSGLGVDPVSGVLTWTPTASELGRYAVEIAVADDGSPPLETGRAFAVVVAPALELTVEWFAENGGGIRIEFATVAGWRYRVEYAAESIGSPWTGLSAEIVGTGATVRVTDGLTEARRYYRVVQTP
jgi:hypothetical protein